MEIEMLIDEIQGPAYIIDITNYELLFLNKYTKKLLNNIDNFEKQKCYKVLQGKNEPCSFCPIDNLDKNIYYTWENRNVVFDSYFTVKTKLIDWNGKLCSINVASEIKGKSRRRNRRKNDVVKEIETDALTKLMLCSCGEEIVSELIEYKSENECCAFLVLDIDYFKLINDNYSTAFGDFILQKVTDIIRSFTMSDDIVYRLGGDEFAIFVKNTSKDEILITAKEICNKVSKIYVGENNNMKLTCSIGISDTDIASDYNFLLDSAMKALQYAKDNGNGTAEHYSYASAKSGVPLIKIYPQKRKITEISSSYSECENIITFALDVLGNNLDMHNAINILLCRTAEQFSIDKITILEFDTEYMNSTVKYQWNGQGGVSNLGKVSYLHKSDYDTLMKRFNSDGMFTLCQSEKDSSLVNSMPACSMLYSAIIINRQIKGAVVFEKNLENYDWSGELQQTLRELSKIISQNLSKVESTGKYNYSQFISNVVNEIKMPANAIGGMIGSLNQCSSIDEVIEFVDKISDCSHFLNILIDDSIELHKIMCGEIKPSYSSFIIKDFISEIKSQSNNLNIQVNSNCTDKTVIADADKLKYIVNCITSYMNRYCNDIKFCLNQQIEEDDCIVAEFKIYGQTDTINPKVLNSFDKDSYAYQSSNMSGLSLIICKNLARILGSNLEMLSENGCTVFKFTVKFVISKSNTSEIHSSTDIISTKYDNKLYGKRLLLVDNDRMNADITKSIIEMADLNVDICNDGIKALKMFELSPLDYYSAIITDIAMPFINGIELTKKIRSTKRADSVTIPIIGVSSHVLEEEIRKVIECGMNGHFSKPIDIKKLLRLLKQLI